MTSGEPAGEVALSRTVPDAAIVAALRAAGCVFAEDEARLLVAGARGPDELAAMVAERVGGLPLEYVLGWADFCGLRLAIDPGVFVPRRRTELLARQVVAIAGERAKQRVVVADLCCGSGAVGAAVIAGLAGLSVRVELHASDIDPVAVGCARRNIPAANGQVYEGDLYTPLPATLQGRVDVLVANAPYVPTEAIELLPQEARVYEPRIALDGGADGLDVLRRVIAGAPGWLAPGGSVLFETSDCQEPLAVEALTLAGLTARVCSSDELGATVVIGTC
jgi:release factor glutamine methyltransferase